MTHRKAVADSPAKLAQESIPLCYLLLLLFPARAKGYDIDDLMRREGLPTSYATAMDRAVTMIQFGRILRRLRRMLRDEMMSLCHRPVRPGTFFLIVRQMLQTKILGDAVRLGCSLYRLVIDDFSLRLRIVGDQAHLEVIDHTPPSIYRSTGHLVMLYGAIGLMSWMVQRPIAVHEVSLPPSFPAFAPAGALFHAAVRDADVSRIVFDSAYLDERVVTDIKGLRSFLLLWPIRKMAPYNEDMPLALHVRKRLGHWDIAHLPSVEEVASTMRLTGRTLRRRLSDEGQSYRAIVDAVRRDAAVRLLDQSRLSVAEIGLRLGFSEPSAFHRAFRRSTGLTPDQYRRQDQDPSN